MTDDFEVSFQWSPSGDLFVLSGSGGSATWSRQSVSLRDADLDTDSIDLGAPYERRAVPREALELIRHALGVTKLLALPSGVSGLGGSRYRLAACDGLTEASWSWWSRLPEEWQALAPILAYLADPSDSLLAALRLP